MEKSGRKSASFKENALKQGMSINDIHEVIISIFEVAFELELKEDELRGVFLALNQMVIKNKVSNEDFRRQLGSRIPGVMNIMADAIGVSITELDKMIRNGEVMSCDVLPKFIAKLNSEMGFTNPLA
jgi:tape measure domain-containing protein